MRQCRRAVSKSKFYCSLNSFQSEFLKSPPPFFFARCPPLSLTYLCGPSPFVDSVCYLWRSDFISTFLLYIRTCLYYFGLQRCIDVRYFVLCITHCLFTQLNIFCSQMTLHSACSLGLMKTSQVFNPLNHELNPICYLLALLGAHHFLHGRRIGVKLLTLRRLMSYIYIYIYGAPILDVSRSHTTTQHSR